MRRTIHRSHRVEAAGERARQLERSARVAHPRQVVRSFTHKVLRLAAALAAAFARCERRVEHVLVARDGEVV